MIQLTAIETLLLERAATGRARIARLARRRFGDELALLVDMQLVVIVDGTLGITETGESVLKHVRRDPPRD